MATYDSTSYILGCNYWASHAGTHMWRQWDESVVAKDFAQLAGLGVGTVRVFPIWDDFQPVSMLHACCGAPCEMAIGEQGIDNPLDPAQLVSLQSFAHFDRLLELAEQNGLKVIVGIVTGWMSGRQFYPPMLENKNLMTDASSLFLEIKFIDYFVNRYKDNPVIVAWGPGNECNTLAVLQTHEQAWLWLNTICNAIRVHDQTRPIISGMHSHTVSGVWRIEDAGDCCDCLTTHPYPLFTPYCDRDALGTMRSVLHSTSQSLYYADLSGKPCIVEEIGSLSPTLGDQETVRMYVKNVLFSTWAHGINGFLWWCGYDQKMLEHAPYQWSNCERELGLIQQDGSPKKLVSAMNDFKGFLQAFPYAKLPSRRVDAVCLLSEGIDHWGVAYSAFTLAKQAGFDIRYMSENQPTPDAPLYILPSIKGCSVIRKRYFDRLLLKIAAGASLLITSDGGFLTDFETLCGLHSKGRGSQITKSLQLGNLTLPRLGTYSIRLEPTTAKVLATGEDGSVAFTVNDYGKGKIYFLDMPLESSLCGMSGTCDPGAPAYYEIYRTFAASVLKTRVQKTCPWIGLTEHALSDSETLVIAINYSQAPVADTLVFPQGWMVDRVLRGSMENGKVSMDASDAAMFVLRKA